MAIDFATIISKLPDKETILAAKRLVFPLTMGVYFLIKDNEIVYVGQSINVIARIMNHAREGRIEFDGFTIIECDASLLNEIETHYIVQFCPPYNATRPPNNTYRTLNQLKNEFNIPKRVLNLWAKSSDIFPVGVPPSQYYRINDFAQFADFIAWLKQRHIPHEQCNVGHVRIYFNTGR